MYTTLQRLERDGLVESDDAGDEGPQKGFRITAEGEDELAGWLRTPPDLSSPPRDELVIKVLVALRVPGVDVHDVIQVHRRYLVELMQQWTRIKEDDAEHDLAWRWSSTPSCSGWTRSSGGWTPPTAAARRDGAAPSPRAAPSPAPGRSLRRQRRARTSEEVRR